MDRQAKPGDCSCLRPVLNPSAPHGLAIIEVQNEAQVPMLIEEDPAVIAGIITTEFYPMKEYYEINMIDP